MNRDHQPCVACFEFDCAAHYCRGHERDQQPDSQPCPLFLERGSKAAQLVTRSRAEVLADLRRRHPDETISRASASPRPASPGGNNNDTGRT